MRVRPELEGTHKVCLTEPEEKGKKKISIRIGSEIFERNAALAAIMFELCI
jgi:hypothetical protein